MIVKRFVVCLAAAVAVPALGSCAGSDGNMTKPVTEPSTTRAAGVVGAVGDGIPDPPALDALEGDDWNEIIRQIDEYRVWAVENPEVGPEVLYEVHSRKLAPTTGDWRGLVDLAAANEYARTTPRAVESVRAIHGGRADGTVLLRVVSRYTATEIVSRSTRELIESFPDSEDAVVSYETLELDNAGRWKNAGIVDKTR